MFVKEEIKKKLGLSVFAFIILTQILTGIFSIRVWPFTDYPMFSLAKKKFSDIKRLYLVDQFKDGSMKKWSRQDYNTLGTVDYRMQTYAHNIDSPDLLKLLKDKLRTRHYEESPVFVSLWLRTMSIKENHIEEKQEMVKKYAFETLAE